MIIIRLSAVLSYQVWQMGSSQRKELQAFEERLTAQTEGIIQSEIERLLSEPALGYLAIKKWV